MSRAILRDTLVCPACEYWVWETDGWSAAHAGELTGIPARTVQDWRTRGWLTPTIEWPPGSKELFYGLGDLVALRCLRMCLDRGADRRVAREVARELAARPYPWRRLATGDLRVALPLTAEAMARARESEPKGRLAELLLGDEPAELAGDGVTIWPLSEVAAELVKEADAWLAWQGVYRPPPWL